MRTLALYWNALVEMFRDPVDPEAARAHEGAEAEPSSLSLALAQMGLVGGGAAGAESRGR